MRHHDVTQAYHFGRLPTGIFTLPQWIFLSSEHVKSTLVCTNTKQARSSINSRFLVSLICGVWSLVCSL